MMFTHITEERQVTLEEALDFLRSFPTGEKTVENFIGFVRENNDTIQFVHVTQDEWFLDIPLQDPSTQTWNKITLQLENVSTAAVNRIISHFFTDPGFISFINSNFVKKENKGFLSRFFSKKPKGIEGVTYLDIDQKFINWILEN